MSLLTSLYTGTTGLQSNSTDLSTIGDNIANSNTVGYKASRVSFQDSLAQNGLGSGEVGLGTRVQGIQKIMTQGALTNTGIGTDLAISGGGFFVVNGAHDGTNGTYFTRDGQFTINNQGYLVNLEGLHVQGYSANATGLVGGALGDLNLGAAASSPNPSANVSLKGNLQSDAVIPGAWSAATPTTTSNFSTGVNVYDSLGNAHEADVYFRRTGTGTWEWHALSDGAGITGGTAGTPVQIGSGTLTYDTNGRLSAMTQASTFNPIGATNPQPLTFNFGDPTGGGGTGVGGLTQFSNASSTTYVNQDGYPAGTLSNISIDSNGEVLGSFTNGQSRALGQVALATFQAPDQLQRVGGNLFSAGLTGSGQAAIGAAGSGGRGAIVAGALEQSNVDLANEFIKMIAAQRGFEANSKIITTSDQLLSELVALKR